MKKSITLFLVVFQILHIYAQLSPADSAYFLSKFTRPKYINDTQYIGQFYLYDTITSMYNHFLIMDTNFVFKYQDMDSIQYLSIDDSMRVDSIRGASFNNYPNLLNQTDPIVYLPYTLLNKHGTAYCFRHIDSNANHCRNAFLIVPGTGKNEGWNITQGTGYHNTYCYVKNACKNYGDVYTFIKPNEEHRAIHWNGKKLDNEYVNWYLTTQYTYYGVNYLIEMIALIKYMKTKYDKVFLLGLSEGGYAAALCLMYEEPHAAMISGGYTIQWDTLLLVKDILRTRFDALVDSFDKVKVKNRFANINTQILFTYGVGDPIPGLTDENLYQITENYLNLPNCSYFYNFFNHSFPPCYVIDTFAQRIINIPVAHFTVHDTTQYDTMWAKVNFCVSGIYAFDLYKDTTFVWHYTNITDSLIVPLTDSAHFYYIKNITDSAGQAGTCKDSIWCTFKPYVFNNIQNDNLNLTQLKINNPFRENIYFELPPGAYNAKVTDITGRTCAYIEKCEILNNIHTANWTKGIYFLNITDKKNYKQWQYKLMKD